MKNAEKSIGIGLLGRGVVGGGVEGWLQKNGKKHNLDLRRIAVRKLDKHKDAKAALTNNPREVIDDTNIQIVVELMGGTEPAGQLILESLDKGKSVVTANKAVLATRMKEIFGAARKNNTDIGFEASVGGGIRIIESMHTYKGDNVNVIKGILNGTTNYILSRMKEGKDFNSALKEAQEKGFAEADHISDTGGFDTRYKIAILASIGFNHWFRPEEIGIRGITDISPIDLDFASKYGTDQGGRGYTIKLLGTAKRNNNGKIELSVSPVMINNADQLAHINDEYNAIFVDSDYAGPHMYTGRGAGRFATASAVIMDILRIAKNIRTGSRDELPTLDSKVTLAEQGNITSKGYLRVNLKHTPGSAAEIFGILAESGLNIEDSMQRKQFSYEHNGKLYIPDIITLEDAKQKEIISALKVIKKSRKIHGEAIYIPIDNRA